MVLKMETESKVELRNLAVSDKAYSLLEQYATFNNIGIKDAAETIIMQFLEHQDFYIQKRRTLDKYLTARNVKILRLLEIAPANTGLISRKTGVAWQTLKPLLEAMVQEGVLKEKNYGSVRFFELNRQSQVTRRLLEIMNLWYNP